MNALLAQDDSLQAPIDSINYDVSIEQLMNVVVSTGTLVSIKQYSTPVSVTTITEKDIALSPARNMLDLMEIHVPGFFWMNHGSEGPKTGMRGIISDRNLKILILVNGVVLSDKGHKGGVAEITNWDLNDIEKIEVIRGPGSVTYGPGAIQGVINIITKKNKDINSAEASVNYWAPYNSKGISLRQSMSDDHLSGNVYGSLQFAQGADASVYKVYTTSKYGYLGDLPSTQKANPYMQNALGIPQMKLAVDFNMRRGVRFFARYNQVSNASSFYEQYKPLTAIDSAARYNDPLVTSGYNRHQEFFTFLEKNSKISSRINVVSTFIYDNENNQNYRYQSPAYVSKRTDTVNVDFVNSIKDLKNIRHTNYLFSEEQITAKSITYYKSETSKFDAAVGAEVSRNSWRAPWFQSKDMIRMGDQKNILSDSLTSPVIVPNGNTSGNGWLKKSEGVYVGSGWHTYTTSFFGEVKYSLNSRLTILASGRVDKDNYSKWLVSPRLAIISELNDKNSLRLILLQSNRMNTAAQMMQQHRAGVLSTPEKLVGGELIYTRVQNRRLIFDFSAFYNKNQVLSWSTTQLSVANTGISKTGGIEASVSYNSKKLTISANHSALQLFDWKLADGITASGISYQDYNLPVTYKNAANVTQTVYIKGYGKHLSNVPQNISKLNCNVKLFSERLILHADSRVYWGFQGMKDGLKALENAFDTVSAPIKSEIQAMVSELNKNKVYGTDLRVNFSVSVRFLRNFTAVAYIQNLVGTGKNKRYFYDSGIVSATAPSKIQYLQEPRAFGLRLSATL